MKAGDSPILAGAAHPAGADQTHTGLPPEPGAALPETTLDALLCFDVYAASRALTRAYRPLLEPLGLTYPQFLVMQSLWEAEAQFRPDGAETLLEPLSALTVGALGDRLALDSGTLSPLLKRLEGAGLVARERSRHDEREVAVLLTPAGRALKERARHVPTEITRLIALSKRDSLLLQDTLRRLRQSVSQNGS